MKEWLKNTGLKVAMDLVFGVIAATFAYFVLGVIVPQILSTNIELANGAIKFSLLFDDQKMKSLFSIRNNFCVLFGIRFLVAYILGGYEYDR